MPPMGRRRKNPDSGLEPRVYLRSGSYYYVHRTGKWENLGQDMAAANEKARLFNDPEGQYGTMVHWLGLFLVDCEARVKAGTLSQRTLDDYTDAIKGNKTREGALALYFAPPMTPLDVTPANIQEFLELNAQLGRPVPANREKAALSSCFGWLLRGEKVPGLMVNPCLRASGIQRNPETKRDRYVTHDEYREVWAVAGTSVRLMMALTYRTLQRPESDIIGWDNRVLATVHGRRVLKFRQGKTGKWMQVGVDDELNDLIRASLGDVPKLRQAIVRTRDGEPYTYDGLSAMLKRCIAKANKARAKNGIEAMPSFGFRDLKGKGATDMWLTKVPIEDIQALCGHEDKATTEIYVKQRWRDTVEPNRVSM